MEIIKKKNSKIELVPEETENNQLFFFNSLRSVTMIAVIFYHVVAAYSSSHIAPYWPFHDSQTTLFADFIRLFFDVFMMPIFFFIAGYFGTKSLQKKSGFEFISTKFRRLMVYWIFIVVFFLPFNWWKFNGLSEDFQNYGEYWLSYLLNIGYYSLGPITSSIVPGPVYHQHFWYIPLLFYMFVGHLFLHSIIGKIREKKSIKSGIIEKKHAITKIIIISSIILSIYYFVTLLFVPDFYWVNINLIVQFQPTKIGGFIITYIVGVKLASSENFNKKMVTGKNILFWGFITISLIFSYFLLGTDIFFNPNIQNLNLLHISLFSLNRAILLISTITLMIKLSKRFLNKPTFFSKNLASQSYNIYLVHIFLVFVFQMVFMNWVNGLLFIKIGIGVLGALILSYMISRYLMDRYMKIFVCILFVLFFILPILADYIPFLNNF